MNSIRCPR